MAFLGSCEKSDGSVLFSGSYVETYPDREGMKLDFLWQNRVIVSGPRSFLTPGTDTVTLRYVLSADSLGSLISLILARGDTVKLYYSPVDWDAVALSSLKCPPGQPCDAIAGREYVFGR